MTQREIHVNEGQYIARVSNFKNINQNRAATDQPPALHLRPKITRSHHGPLHRVDQQTNTSHILSPLHKLWTNHSNRTEPEMRRMYKSHLQSQ